MVQRSEVQGFKVKKTENHRITDQRNSDNPEPRTLNPERLIFFQIFSDDAADFITVPGQDIVDNFFGGTF